MEMLKLINPTKEFESFCRKYKMYQPLWHILIYNSTVRKLCQIIKCYTEEPVDELISSMEEKIVGLQQNPTIGLMVKNGKMYMSGFTHVVMECNLPNGDVVLNIYDHLKYGHRLMAYTGRKWYKSFANWGNDATNPVPIGGDYSIIQSDGLDLNDLFEALLNFRNKPASEIVEKKTMEFFHLSYDKIPQYES